jgi:hypothetical protein
MSHISEEKIHQLQEALNKNQGKSQDARSERLIEGYANPPLNINQWDMSFDEKGNVYFQHSDFTYDAGLHLSGDFGNHEEKVAFGQKVLKALNDAFDKKSKV